MTTTMMMMHQSATLRSRDTKNLDKFVDFFNFFSQNFAAAKMFDMRRYRASRSKRRY